MMADNSSIQSLVQLLNDEKLQQKPIVRIERLHESNYRYFNHPAGNQDIEINSLFKVFHLLTDR